MTLTFADTHNMIAYLIKSDANEEFNQIIDFLNGSSIKLQALVNKKRVIIREATIRDARRLDDAEGVDCLPNEEIFGKLARMGYEKPSTKLTFYKVFSQLSKECGQFNQVLHVSTFLTTYNNSPSSVAAEGDVSVANDFVPTDVDKPSIPSPPPSTQPPPPSQDIPSTSQKLERRNKASKLKRLQKVGIAQRIETFDDTVMDDVSKQGRMIADMDADVDVTLKDVAAIAKDGQDAKMEENDEVEAAELKEVVEVVTTAKLIAEVVTAASVTITVAAPQLTIVAPPNTYYCS
nr:hypothetical protein [Tanacetum cinerariifolium]